MRQISKETFWFKTPQRFLRFKFIFYQAFKIMHQFSKDTFQLLKKNSLPNIIK